MQCSSGININHFLTDYKGFQNVPRVFRIRIKKGHVIRVLPKPGLDLTIVDHFKLAAKLTAKLTAKLASRPTRVNTFFYITPLREAPPPTF